MEIIMADYYGTCFGVDRALDMTNEALNNYDTLYCLGELIHNRRVVERFEKRGLKVINDLESLDLKEGKKPTLILRSHGVGKAAYEYCKYNDIKIIDATCPKVKKIHEIVESYSSDGYSIIIFGNENHPEIIGIKGWSAGKAYIYSDLDDFIDNHKEDLSKSCIVFQTTYNTDKFNKIKEYFNNSPNNDIIFKSTICNATERRQNACRKLAGECDIVLVVGGKQSSNTKKLFEIGKEICKNTFWIENSNEIPYNLIKNTKRLGITAGASTPLWVIEEVILNVRKK
ncbi:4-hydroxy-3-methylbut-2-enyl diphosphate reductase [Dethiosulfatibacter aminovorans DSM 17477]|uniref:4-hydroxy-3-methylbut-2-enyl diphosphate reductase n=1 Tax=Dethiosulfatibacter aminovorans DSM 17477 TaxID=1121476 RepID=A0A1M6DBT1_9FIRM|nr:4-hydroxy-3-methylbut-2-enyl diphosphate reductase [Dethiosulfatibacter aminovorans]SHI70498.1 4-hydroxy-3-methylbut-2-enyl diphosphate reductase [Dethiosulfatibacter aminovorans DSM 17477]